MIAACPSVLADDIAHRLACLLPQRLDIRDDTVAHAGHRGLSRGARHLQLVIVSRTFETMSLLEQHRSVYSLLRDLIPDKIHALSLKTLVVDPRRF